MLVDRFMINLPNDFLHRARGLISLQRYKTQTHTHTNRLYTMCWTVVGDAMINLVSNLLIYVHVCRIKCWSNALTIILLSILELAVAVGALHFVMYFNTVDGTIKLIVVWWNRNEIIVCSPEKNSNETNYSNGSKYIFFKMTWCWSSTSQLKYIWRWQRGKFEIQFRPPKSVILKKK